MAHEKRAESFGRYRRAAGCVLFVTLVHLSCVATASGQEAEEHVRVPTKHANVHMGPSTGRPVLVLVAEGTVLPVHGRRGEWLEVELSAELRETGMVVRWYRDEDRGWMHESTVEFVEVESPSPRS